MTITNPNASIVDTADWVHSAFAVSVGTSFTSYQTIMQNINTSEVYANSTKSEAMGPIMSQLLSNCSDNSGGLSPVYFTQRKCRDTSLGGNDAINCLWAFNEDDDPAHPFTYAHINGTVGMGRTYSEIYDDQQQIMYLGFGTPIFNSLTAFYTGAFNTPLADLMNSGPDGMNFGEVMGTLLGKGVSTILTLPAIPAIILKYVAQGAGVTPISRYYDFKPQMALYYRFVNTILVQLAVNMGLLDQNSYSETLTTGSVTSPDTTFTSMLSSYGAIDQTDGSIGVPDYLQGAPDILKILSKKTQYDKGELGFANYSTDAVLQEQCNPSSTPVSYSGVTDSSAGTNNSGVLGEIWSAVNAFKNALGISLSGAALYIGFRIEKGVDTSETISNQTTESPLKQSINQKMQSARTEYFDTEGGHVSDNPLAKLAGIAINQAAGFLKGITSQLGLSGLNALAVGSGMIDIPDIWSDSSFSKNYSFNMALRAPYGDPITIMQSEYIPLACLLAGALPRAIGANSYTSPFLCRAYCKGFFAVPLGIIDNINIRRGGDIHGWTNMRLPTQMDVSFSIKDLSPAMYMAMAGADLSGELASLVGADSTFNQYLMTLSGMGVLEQTSPMLNIQRRLKILGESLLRDRLNPTYWGLAWGERTPLRFITNIMPVQKLLSS